MSHFTVGVILNKYDVERMGVHDALQLALEPYSENLEVEPYFVMTHDEAKEEHYDDYKDFLERYNKSNDDNVTFEKFVESFGFILKEDGFYSTFNKDSKYDWYVIGGRWRGSLPIKNSQYVKSDDQLHAYSDSQDYAQIKDIKFNKEVSEEQIQEYKEEYKKLSESDNIIHKMMLDDCRHLDDYIFDKTHFTTYAILTSDGEWIEPGKMLMFGISEAEVEKRVTFKKDYLSIIEKEDKENYFVLVDCHV